MVAQEKNSNTAKMLKSVKEGAESKGYQVEYYDLYDLSFTGCRSCLACKLKDGRRNHCFWKDDLKHMKNIMQIKLKMI